MDKKELMVELEGLKSALETTINEKTKSEIADQLKSMMTSVEEKINALPFLNVIIFQKNEKTVFIIIEIIFFQK